MTGCQIVNYSVFSRTSVERNGRCGGHPFVRGIGDSFRKVLQIYLTIELITLHCRNL